MPRNSSRIALDERRLLGGHRRAAAPCLVPRQVGVPGTEQRRERHALGHAARDPARRCVEPDVAESEPERAVVEQCVRSADVIVVDVADDRQVDVARAVDRGNLRQPFLQRGPAFVGAGVDEQTPLAACKRARDQHGVTVGGGQRFDDNGGRCHAGTRADGSACGRRRSTTDPASRSCSVCLFLVNGWLTKPRP